MRNDDKNQVVTRDYLDKKLDNFALLAQKGFEHTASKTQVDALEKRVKRIEERMATKDDLKPLATREEVNRYLELSEDRYLELKTRLKIYEQRFALIADTLNIQYKA